MMSTDPDDPGFEDAVADSIRMTGRPPRRAIDYAASAIDDHCTNGPIARLALDSADLSLSVRGESERQVVFEIEDIALDMVIANGRVEGQVVPAGHRTLEMVGRAGWRRSVNTDADGYFVFDETPTSSFYICCRQLPVRTAWITH